MHQRRLKKKFVRGCLYTGAEGAILTPPLFLSGHPPPVREQRPRQNNTGYCFRKFWVDLNWLTCFRKFWNRGHVAGLVFCENHVCPVIRGWGWHSRDAYYCPATFCPYLRYMTLMHLHGHGCLGSFAACVFTRCTQTTPLSQQRDVLLPSFSVFLRCSQKRGGGIAALTPPPRPALGPCGCGMKVQACYTTVEAANPKALRHRGHKLRQDTS